jgi:serine/threonine-protein kinase RsbW
MQMSTDRPYVVSLVVPAEPKWLALGRLVLSGVCQLGPVDEETLADLKLAVTEACSNSVRHAYEDGGSGEIEVRYELGHDSLSVEISDAGRGFRFDRPLPELGPQPDEELREDEMGLAIIHALADEVAVGAGPDGRGTRIRFRKSLSTVGPNGAAAG